MLFFFDKHWLKIDNGSSFIFLQWSSMTKFSVLILILDIMPILLNKGYFFVRKKLTRNQIVKILATLIPSWSIFFFFISQNILMLKVADFSFQYLEIR